MTVPASTTELEAAKQEVLERATELGTTNADLKKKIEGITAHLEACRKNHNETLEQLQQQFETKLRKLKKKSWPSGIQA